MRRRLCDLVRDLTGAGEISTPILYDGDAPGILEESAPFLDQVYRTADHGGRAFLLPDQLAPRGPGELDAYLSSLGRADAIGPLNRRAALRIAKRFGCAVEALEALADGESCRLC
jgi:hypothetical protein